MSREELLNPNILREIAGFIDAQTVTNLTIIASEQGTDLTHTFVWSEIFKRHFPEVYEALTADMTYVLTETNWCDKFHQQYLAEYEDEFTRNVVRAVRDDDVEVFMKLFSEKYLNHQSTHEDAALAGARDAGYILASPDANVDEVLADIEERALSTVLAANTYPADYHYHFAYISAYIFTFIAQLPETRYMERLNNLLNVINNPLAKHFSSNDGISMRFCADLRIDIYDFLNDSTRNISKCLYAAATAIYGLRNDNASLMFLAICLNQPVAVLADHYDVITSQRETKDVMVFQAIAYNRVLLLEYLLNECNTDVNARIIAVEQSTPLELAIEQNHREVLEFLLQHKDMIIPQDIMGHAVMHGSVETCKILIDHGANISFSTPTILPPLFMALRANNVAIAELLITKLRANPTWNISTYTRENLSPLEFAMHRSNTSVCEMLLRNGANLFHDGIDPSTSPLDILCKYRYDDLPLVDAMLQYVQPEDLDYVFLLAVKHYNAYLLRKILSDNPWSSDPRARIDNGFVVVAALIWSNEHELMHSIHWLFDRELRHFHEPNIGLVFQPYLVPVFCKNVCDYIIAKTQDIWTPGRGPEAYSRLRRFFGFGATNAQKIEAAKELLRVALQLKPWDALQPYGRTIRSMNNGHIWEQMLVMRQRGWWPEFQEDLAPEAANNNLGMR